MAAAKSVVQSCQRKNFGKLLVASKVSFDFLQPKVKLKMKKEKKKGN